MGNEHRKASGADGRFPVPNISELIAETKDMRKNRKKSIAIIIPSNAKPDVLFKHFDTLSRQTSKDFDAIVIYGIGDRFIDPPAEISAIHLRRSYDYGSAGAFFCGERFAYEEGYRKIILADDDCFPESDDLIEEIGSTLDRHQALMCKTRFRPQEQPRTYVLAQYGAFRREVLEKAGYSFFPFFFGAEDVDLKDRIERSGIEIASIDKVVFHPPPQNFLLWGKEKTHYFLRNSNIYNWLKYRSRIFFFMSSFGCVMISAYLHAIGHSSLGWRYLRALWSASSMNLMKENLGAGDMAIISKSVDGPHHSLFDSHPEYLRFNIWYGFPALWPSESGMQVAKKSMKPLLSEQIGFFGKSIKCFGRRIHFKDWISDFNLLPILFSNGSTADFEGETYTITSGRGPFSILFGLAFVSASIAPAAVISALLTLRVSLNDARRITDGYGIKPEKDIPENPVRTIQGM